MELVQNNRILIIDDNSAIHEDFRKVLAADSGKSDSLDWIKAEMLGEAVSVDRETSFVLSSAFQGQEGLQKVQDAADQGAPYAMAFVDVRMPPGWDGVETIHHLWKVDQDLEIVICSAYSDYSWDDITEKLGKSDRLLVLKKPFDSVEVIQMAHALTRKWALQRAARLRADQLETAVSERNRDLERANSRLAEELKDRKQMEAELRLAQKLEAVGQLAAGIAHEINTPVQYVSDSLHFLKTSFGDMDGLCTKYQVGCGRLAGIAGHEAFVEELKQAEDDADMLYLKEHIPKAFERAIEGLVRVATIVKAMKEFAHDDCGQKTLVDLNHALTTTLEVARNEYKYCAIVETSLIDLPLVMCLAGEMNQVFLNLIVNAAHAIVDVVGDSGDMGVIRICTKVHGERVLITIEDSGGGIPVEIQQRIFDPFFTTKPVGRGTGQGLAIARKVVVDKHGGELSFKSKLGRGTQFIVSLPLQDSGTVRP